MRVMSVEEPLECDLRRTRGYPILAFFTWQHVGARPLRSRDPHIRPPPATASNPSQPRWTAAIVGATQDQLVAPTPPRTTASSAPSRPNSNAQTLHRESGARLAPPCYVTRGGNQVGLTLLRGMCQHRLGRYTLVFPLRWPWGVPMASPSPLSPARERHGVGHRRTVEMELDAARALTDLAGSAATGCESGGEEWKRNESRSRKRSKSKSPERAQLGSFQGQEETSILGVR